MTDVKKILMDGARQKPVKVIVHEADDERVLRATEIILKEKIAIPVLIGENIEKIQALIKKLGLNLSNVELITPKTYSNKESLAKELYELRKYKGLSLEDAKKLLDDQFYLGVMLLHKGEAGAITGTCVYPTAALMKPALQIIKTKDGVAACGVSIMIDRKMNKVFLAADADITIDPNAEQLADIAVSTANAAEALGIEPKVAFLSYSTKGSGGGHPSLGKIRQALELAKKKKPGVIIDGELQLDAAILKEGCMRKCPASPVKGEANCLIFPDLTSANIGLKLWMEFGDVQYIGPLNMGMKKPVNELGRTFKPEDIANTVMLCAFMANKGI
ncbi:phosphate acetyltransferase [Candidatus Woesearchaeota archaeon]|nr:phosphate acetyltransferase [Candidatus Woesearchaeota archaeon]